MIPFVPAIIRTTEPGLYLTLPMKPWELASAGVGGSAVAASGATESYEIRVDRTAMVTLRLEEIEVEDFLLAIEAIRRTSETFTFLFDQTDDYTGVEVYLNSPVWPAPIDIKRSEFPGVFEATLELRSVNSAPFTQIWLED